MYLVATQNTLFLELGTPRRLRQLFTTVILYPAAVNIGRMTSRQTGLARLVVKLRVFSITKARGCSLQASLAHATATCALGSSLICAPADENAWQGGEATSNSSPGGTASQMRSMSAGRRRSALRNGVLKLRLWYFCTELQMSTLSTTCQPHRSAAMCQPPAPAQRSNIRTGAFRSLGVRSLEVSVFVVVVARLPVAPSPCCSPCLR